MKICRTLLFVLFAVLLSSSVSAQLITNFDIQIFTPLPELDLGALSMANDLSGAPKVFQISILPLNVDVILEGEITWTDIGKTSALKLFDFKTRAFKSRSFYNTDLGSTDIRIARTNSNNTVINEIIKKGKPTGRFDINLTLTDPQGGKRIATGFVEFINPTQSFTILTPSPYAEVQLGNIVVSWIQVPGSDRYKIKVNKRTNSNQSLENALASPSPFIVDEISKEKTSVRLSDLKSRRPLEDGYEYVLQVTAVLRLPSGDKELPSEIINFRIAGLNDARDNSIKNSLMSISQSLPGISGSTLINLLSDKNLRINRLLDENGNPISEDQLRNLLNYLNANPSQVVSVQFNQ